MKLKKTAILLNHPHKKHVKKNIVVKMEIQFRKRDEFQQKELAILVTHCLLFKTPMECGKKARNKLM